MDIEKSLLDSQWEAEALVKLIEDARAKLGSRGSKIALSRVRRQSMVTRKKLKELRVDILEACKHSKGEE